MKRMGGAQLGKFVDPAEFLLDIADAGLVSWVLVLAGGSYNSAGLPGLMLVLAIGVRGADLRMRDARMMIDMVIV